MNIRKNYKTHLAISGAIAVIGLGVADRYASFIGCLAGVWFCFVMLRYHRCPRCKKYLPLFDFKSTSNDTATIGYDAMFETMYSNLKSSIINHQYSFSFRARAKRKGNVSTYSARAQFDWQSGPWSLRTTGEANLTDKREASNSAALNYGFTAYQDVSFDCTPYTIHHTPLSIRLRLQGFDCRNWANRIYAYEHDVLYAFSIPATYGLGGRAYVCLKWQALPQLALYLKVSETVYQKTWAFEHDKSVTRTDVHFLLRAMF